MYAIRSYYAGFGGQGVLSMGKILAYSGLMQGQEVSWMPSYGPEQRGGTANVTVILSDERISSPVLNTYDTAIVLNQPSLDRFESKVKPGGTLIYDGNGFVITSYSIHYTKLYEKSCSFPLYWFRRALYYSASDKCVITSYSIHYTKLYD